MVQVLLIYYLHLFSKAVKLFVTVVEKLRVTSMPKYLKPSWTLLKGNRSEGLAAAFEFIGNSSLFCKLTSNYFVP